jgi:F0F1-type ATP synthase beta subunit
MEIKEAICIPYYRIDNEKTFESIKRPYYDIIEELQTLRRKHKKGTIKNLLYKEMANSIYGNTVRGISTKKVFDIKTGSMVHLEAGELSNPILGSYTTALIRSVIGETLHNIQKLGGTIVSVTTDGFITNVDDLENKLLNLPEDSIKLLNIYRDMRFRLSGNLESYELKNKGKGIIS